MDKEIEEIMEEIERQLRTVTDAERVYRKLSPDERARLPESLRVRFEPLAEWCLAGSPCRAPAVKPEGCLSLSHIW